MGKEFTFERVFKSDSWLVDVIFIHGLTGDAQNTWISEKDGVFWPTWLGSDLKYLNIYTLGYPSSLFEKWAKKEMDIFERAGNVLEYLAALDIGHKPIVFITHSLGGI